jgi:hypothetical protein
VAFTQGTGVRIGDVWRWVWASDISGDVSRPLYVCLNVSESALPLSGSSYVSIHIRLLTLLSGHGLRLRVVWRLCGHAVISNQLQRA